jgi:hypothetical protein
MLYKKIVTILSFIVIFLSSLNNSFAAGLHTIDYNYINDFIGSRATGMAGAYTAISDDPSGTYYNPAGIIFAYDNQISLSVNSYKNKRIEMSKAIDNNSYTQNSGAFYPSFFGVVQSLGSFKIGASFLTINNEILDQDDFFTGIFAYADDGNPYPADFRINYNITDSTVIEGLTLAGYITDTLSFGATVFGLWRKNQQIANMMVRFDKTSTSEGITYYYNNVYISEEMFGALIKLGFQYMPLNTISIGYAFSLGNIFSHKYNKQILQKAESASGDMGSGGYYMATSNRNYSDSRLPVNHRLGVAFFPNNKTVVSADVIADLGNKYYQQDVKNTINYAIGAEFFITPLFPIRFGVFTNFANTPKINDRFTNQEMHVDLYGASASLGWQTKSSSVSLCGFYQYGRGESQIISGVSAVQETVIQIFSISLAGSAKY